MHIKYQSTPGTLKFSNPCLNSKDKLSKTVRGYNLINHTLEQRHKCDFFVGLDQKDIVSEMRVLIFILSSRH